MNITELDKILLELDYYETFEKYFLNQDYNEIDYGKKLGIIKFNSFFEANEKYSYSNQIVDDKFLDWNLTLNDTESTEVDILITCLEIFDWGHVLKGNVKTALRLYNKEELKSYIKWIKPLLSQKETIHNNQLNSSSHEVIWSSGWTKVYSFMNNDILIYDSKVSAFLNYTLIRGYENLDNSKINRFLFLVKNLFNFNGVQGRRRQVDKSIGFKNQHPNGINGFNVNLISSWIVQLLNERLNLNMTIRTFERAFFMLGFDLKQLECKMS